MTCHLRARSSTDAVENLEANPLTDGRLSRQGREGAIADRGKNTPQNAVRHDVACLFHWIGVSEKPGPYFR